MTLKIEEFSESRAVREDLIETRYTGKNSEIAGTSGGAAYDIKNGQWYYKPNGSEEEYRVDGKNLSCNEDNGWIKCEYRGANKLFGLNKLGKAYFDDTENTWKFKPRGSKELFRVGEGNLVFIRDRDLTTDENEVE